jgi:hypothetical protein
MLDGLGGRVTAKLGFQIFRHTSGKKMHCERKAWSITAGSQVQQARKKRFTYLVKRAAENKQQKETGKNPCGYCKASLQ